MNNNIVKEINELLDIKEALPIKVIDNDAISFIENNFPDFKEDDTLIAIIQKLFDSADKYGVTVLYKSELSDPVFILRKGFVSIEIVAMSGRFQVFTDQTFATEDNWENLIVKPVEALNACLKEWKEG